MPNWWSNPNVNPKWRPPRAQKPGAALERIRDQLNAIIDDANGELWLKALAELLPAEAIEAFLGHKQMTPDEIRTISGFCSEFGEDMGSGRLVRRGHPTPPAPPHVPEARSSASWFRLWR